ncbi:MAG: hypothetical protein Q4C52_08655 [Eubacteriales bacterium]|nr:hypothetical protein [Eubacteriales bacterium]
MIYLLSAIGVNLCMTFLMRYSENHNGNRYALNIWNYIAGTLISIVMLEDRTLIWSGDKITLGVGIVNGIGFVVALTLIQLSIRRNGAPLTTTFNRLGILIPTILSAFLFREIPTVLQITGLILCVFAIIFMNSGSREERPAFGIGLLLVFLLGGTLDSISKIFSRYYGADSQTCFVLYTFFAALIVSIILFVNDGGKMSKQDIIVGIGVGIPNQLTTLFLLRAASGLPAYVVYPTYSAGLIILVNIINYLAFRETLSKRQYIATGIIGLGLIFINLL